MRAARLTRIALCALALAGGGALTGCGNAPEPGVDEPAREGLAIGLDGLDYNVFITRQLNLEIPPDEAYYSGPAPEPGNSFYGIFIQVCNNDSDKPVLSTDDFTVTDNQGNEFEPIELPEENAFGYRPEMLPNKECIPARGSVAQLGPSAGAMLLFEFPAVNTENRPLELEIAGEFNALEGKREHIEFELDL